MKIKFILPIILLSASATIFAQTESVSKNNLLDPTSKPINSNLLEYVETMYITSSSYYNELNPSVKTGDFIVLISKDGLDYEPVKTKDLKGITKDKIMGFQYHKSPMHDALYGDFARKFGIIMIQLK